MIKSPANKLILSIKPVWIKHFTDIQKIIQTEQQLNISLAECVNIVGEVISVPKYISPLSQYKGYSTKDIKEGDIAIFSYDVVASLKHGEEGKDPIFQNAIYHEAKEFFLADITSIFAVIRGEEIIMINGWVQLSEIEDSKIIVPHNFKSNKFIVSSTILNIGHSKTHLKGIDANIGDNVFFDKRKVQHYEINRKKFIITSQEKLLGKIK